MGSLVHDNNNIVIISTPPEFLYIQHIVYCMEQTKGEQVYYPRFDEKSVQLLFHE